MRQADNAEYLAKLILERKAQIYVSGRAKFMPASVEKAFAEMVSKYGKVDGTEMVKNMKKTRKYQ